MTDDDIGRDESVEHAPAPARPARNPLTVQSLRLANRVHESLRQWGRAELGERIAAEAADWGRQQLVVVACGDVKRGKSSLLNALLDRSTLLPVDADVATSVHLVVSSGDELAITVTRLGPDGEPEVEGVDVVDLVDVASMRGDATRREGVVSVEITLDHPLLDSGVVLIDTPGVGGMSRGHRDLALAALARADVLLFMVSAQEPIARSELEFLTEATERTERLMLVVTKADVNTEDANAAMLDEHRAKVRTFAEQLRDQETEGAALAAARVAKIAAAPMLLTSSYLAEQSRTRRAAGREEQADRLFERSGLAPLRRFLEHSADQREDIRVANLLALLRTLLAEAEREQQTRRRVSAGDTSANDDVVQLQAAMEHFGSTSARWRTTLANSIVRLQTNASRQVTHDLNRVREHYRDVVESARDVERLNAELPGDLERSLHAAWNELVESINRDFQSTLGAMLDDFGTAGMDAVLGRIDMPEALSRLQGARAVGASEPSLLDDGLPLALQTFTFANIANAAAGALGLATGGLGLAAYGIGAAIAYPIGRMRRQQREQQRARSEHHRYVSELLFGTEGVAKEFATELSLRILDLREQVERFVEQRLGERKRQLDHEQRELQTLMRAEASKRHEAEQAATRRLDEIARLQAEIEPLERAVEARLALPPQISR
jgi:signal recognition particle receptor subunit beta